MMKAVQKETNFWTKQLMCTQPGLRLALGLVPLYTTALFSETVPTPKYGTGLCPGGQFWNLIPPDRPGQASVRQLQSPY